MALSDKEMVLGIVLLVAVIGLMIVGGDLAGKAFERGLKQDFTKADIDKSKLVQKPSIVQITDGPGISESGSSEEEFSGIIGDVNDDGTVNVLDMVNLVNAVTGTSTAATSCSSDICAGDLTYLLHNENSNFPQEIGLDLMDAVWLSNCLIDFQGTCESIVPGCMDTDSTYYNEDANMNCCCSNNFLSAIVFPVSPTNVYSGTPIAFSIELSFNFEAQLPEGFNEEGFIDVFNEGIDENIFSFQLLDELSEYDNSEYFQFLGSAEYSDTHKKIYNFVYNSPEVEQTSSGRFAVTIDINHEGFSQYFSFLADFDEDGIHDYITIKVYDEESSSTES